MPIVDYSHEFPYTADDAGDPFPKLLFRLSAPGSPDNAVDLDGYLDSGAQRSVFAGWLAEEIGLVLLEGQEIVLASATGATIEARLHTVVLTSDDLGEFVLEAAFTLTEVPRQLLGRDFFALVQLGFREKHLMLYVVAAP